LVESGQRLYDERLRAGREVFEMVGVQRFVAGVALVEVERLGQRRTFRVIVSEDTRTGRCSTAAAW
jgi:hypothetical protein